MLTTIWRIWGVVAIYSDFEALSDAMLSVFFEANVCLSRNLGGAQEKLIIRNEAVFIV